MARRENTSECSCTFDLWENNVVSWLIRECLQQLFSASSLMEPELETWGWIPALSHPPRNSNSCQYSMGQKQKMWLVHCMRFFFFIIEATHSFAFYFITISPSAQYPQVHKGLIFICILKRNLRKTHISCICKATENLTMTSQAWQALQYAILLL